MAALAIPKTRSPARVGRAPKQRDPRERRRSDSSWDFRGQDTRYATHGIFRYPAMMVAPLVRRLIAEYGPVGGTGNLLDPFCGSGSALVEAMLHGMNSVGIDLNPFAVRLATVKATPLDPESLHQSKLDVEARFNRLPVAPPEVDLPNLEAWFPPRAIQGLGRLRRAIQSVSPTYQGFFEICLAETARHVSWTRRDEYKVFRIPKEKRGDWNPEVLATFSAVATRNVARMEDFASMLPTPIHQARVLAGDVRTPGTIPKEEYDMIVTSPPYGDSRTTVAYGQFSSLSLAWLGYDRKAVNSIDRDSLGGTPVTDSKAPPASPTLAGHLRDIAAKDAGRAAEVSAFYDDLCTAFRNVAAALSPGARACVVVGNRTVKGVRLETDVILSELFENECGLVHEDTIVRGIPNKVMPLRNSPSNIAGHTGETMANEYVLVLSRPRG